jgi:hypothetical protein
MVPEEGVSLVPVDVARIDSLYPEGEVVVAESVLEPEAIPLFSEGEMLRFTVEPDEVSEIDGASGASSSPVTASEALGIQKTEPAMKESEKVKRRTARGGK